MKTTWVIIGLLLIGVLMATASENSYNWVRPAFVVNATTVGVWNETNGQIVPRNPPRDVNISENSYFGGNLYPATNMTGLVGSFDLRWKQGFFDTLNVTNLGGLSPILVSADVISTGTYTGDGGGLFNISSLLANLSQYVNESNINISEISPWKFNGTNIWNRAIYDRVGIGTTNPGAKLEVNGSILAGQENTNTNYLFYQGGSGQTIVARNDAQKTWFTTSSGGNYLQTLAKNFAIGTYDDHNLYFRTNKLLRMSILNTGFVGINISTPSYPLEIYGSTDNISIYASDQVSASGFVDRTPYPENIDALSIINNIKSDGEGNLLHSSLGIARTTIQKPIYDTKVVEQQVGNETDFVNETYIVGYEEVEGRDLSMTTSLLTIAIQQLSQEIEDLKARIAVLEKLQ